MLFLALLTSLNLTPQSPDVPLRQPQLAASGQTVVLTYGAGKAIYAAVSRDAGKHFAEAVKVADVPQLMLGRHRGPRVLLSGSEIVITAVAGSGAPAPEGVHLHGASLDGDLLAWRSDDGGKTWSGPARVNDMPRAAREGLHNVAASPSGRLMAVWLDDRAGKGKQLFGATSDDHGATWSKNVLVYESPDGTICQCCHPSIIASANGEFEIMWRNALGGSRDLYLIRTKDGRTFSQAAKLGQGTWKLEACPMDGGGLAYSKGQLVTSWRRESSLYLAEPGKAELKLGDGKDVALAATSNSTYAIWSSPKGIEMWRTAAQAPKILAEQGAFPSAIALPNGTVLGAWESGTGITVRELP